jgi:small-conductance mechanosensitive channel
VAEEMLFAAEQSFLEANADWINAIAFIVVAAIVAKVIDSLISHSVRKVGVGSDLDPLSQSAVTRLRLVRRLIVLGILLIGVFLALSQISALEPLGNALLASSAVIALAVGLASQAVLSNAVAGVMLSTVQPFRIGDVIEWNAKRGRVEDITLTYTFLRLPSGHRLVIPNQQMATSSVENYTIAGEVVDADASIWVPPARATGAMKLLREKLDDVTIALGECEVDRYELLVSFSTTAGHEATQRIATREQVVAILSDAGMLDSADQAA